MKIQLLTFPGCPNAAPMRAALLEAVRRLGLDPVEEIDVTAAGTPDGLRAWPSPTVLVDGVDLDGLPAPADAGGCRLMSAPSAADVERKLRARVPVLAPSVPDGARRSGWLGGGAILAALAASACCLGPVAFAAVGLSGVGLAVALEPWRPVLLGLTAVLIGAGLWLSFRGARSAEAVCCPVPRTRRVGRWTMVAVAAVAVLLAAYPWLAGDAVARARGGSDDGRATATARLAIEGITCAACASGIARELSAVPGVAAAEVDVDRDLATVRYDPTVTDAAALAAVVSAMPDYEATPLETEGADPSTVERGR